ncbi:extensin-2-like isoform X1 [Colias croceus]|uniref:extensin-2-like isoform X1 n=1 Tax=Colias crocea TaxID=72248 RepID=UPI001E28030F|nr:extensin-2-like isoform X1 [Colias croceus]
MAENGYGPTPVVGHIGRIPNYGKTQANQFSNPEPPACIQNAMMTKDKKPFTYTPGGLDLSQIKTPSMARRLARQRSLEDHEQSYPQGNGNYSPQGGPAPPPPPPMKIPAPPPPPPLVIEAPNAKAPKPIAMGERPEIVIPENPIGMLRKTNSPYHWEAEKAELQRIGPVPKFVEKVPSPLTVKLPQHNVPQNYGSPQSNYQRQNTYGNQHSSPDSPLHRPEAQYGNQKTMSANMNGSPPMREILQRQDSQFNKSPQPFANQSPFNNSAPYSPTPNNHWRQPERRDSPVITSPQSPQTNRGPFSPNVQQSSPIYNQVPQNNVFHTLPRAGQRNQENITNNVQNNYGNPAMNNVREVPQQNFNSNTESANTAPWRTNTLNRYPRENQQPLNNEQNVNQPQSYTPQWRGNDAINKQSENNASPPWKRENVNAQKSSPQPQYNPPWVHEDSNRNKGQTDNHSAPWRSQETERSAPNSSPETRYQSSISIPVTPRKQAPQPQYNNSPSQKEVVYVNQEPVYYCPDSPKSIPPWVKTQKEKTKTPPPIWCQRPLDGSKAGQRELETPPRDSSQEPEWVRKSNEMQRGARDVISPPKYQQSAQPNWSTRPSENRKSLPRDNNQQYQQQPSSRIIPIQMEVSGTETRNQKQQGNHHPHLRIIIDMKQNPDQNQPQSQAPYSQPTQRIMRVLSPQLVRTDEGSTDRELPTLNRSFQNQDSQPKTRIIPIQVEDGNGGANKRVYYHKIACETPQRQSKSFKVLQVVTGTGPDQIQIIEDRKGYTDL